MLCQFQFSASIRRSFARTPNCKANARSHIRKEIHLLSDKDEGGGLEMLQYCLRFLEKLIQYFPRTIHQLPTSTLQHIAVKFEVFDNTYYLHKEMQKKGRH